MARRLLDLPRVVELGVRRGVYHLACREIRSLDSSGCADRSRDWKDSYLVARREIRSLCSSGYVDCSRDWKDSYPVVLAVKDRANNPYHLVSERQVDHREGVRPVEDRSAGL